MDLEFIFEEGLRNSDIKKIDQATIKLGKSKIYQLFVDIIEEDSDEHISLDTFIYVIEYLNIQPQFLLKYINNIHIDIITYIVSELSLGSHEELDILIKNLIKRDKSYTLCKILKIYSNQINKFMIQQYKELSIEEYEDSGHFEVILAFDPEFVRY
jgi:hypothetical protein